jgi:ATP-dependent RNA helicase DeaD
MSGISSWTEVHNEATALAKRRKRTPEPSEQPVDSLHDSAMDQEQESLDFDGPYGWGKTGRPPVTSRAADEVTEATKQRRVRKAATAPDLPENIDDELLDEASPYGWGRSGRPPVTTRAAEGTSRPAEPPRAKLPAKPKLPVKPSEKLPAPAVENIEPASPPSKPARRRPADRPARRRSAEPKSSEAKPSASKPLESRTAAPAKPIPPGVSESEPSKAPTRRAVVDKPPARSADLPSRSVADKPPAEAADLPRRSAVDKPPTKAAGLPRRPVGKFGNLPLSEVTLAALDKAEYIDPTPVQVGVIARAIEGVDLMAQAQTGTGKTAAFAIPILEQLQPRRAKGEPQAIVLLPTRELAVQVRDECAKLAFGRKVSIVALYGGKPIRKQTEQLRDGADVVVGTPGRILDHIDRRTLNLAGIRIAVLDEADRMLDIGFRPDIEKILRRCPESRQTLLFSATIPAPVRRLAERYMRDPESYDFSPKDLAVETIEQFYYTVDGENKFDLVVALLREEKPRQAIIFCRTKRGTEKVCQRLSRRFESVATIHGDLPQNTRDRVMGAFRRGEIRHLVATDVVGRGIDVTGVSHIINYDIPQFADDYVHRVGRTGRMGREGVAFTFVTPEEGPQLTRIEMRINRLLIRRETQELLPSCTDERRPVRAMPAAALGDLAAEAAIEPNAAPARPATKPVFGRPMRRIRRAL